MAQHHAEQENMKEYDYEHIAFLPGLGTPGQILRQREGILMGDPLSPGMTIGATAWMENEWMQTMEGDCRKYFRIKRFMDDICRSSIVSMHATVVAYGPWWR